MINWLKNYINSRDYSEGFFSKKLKVRIGILILALIFLAVAVEFAEVILHALQVIVKELVCVFVNGVYCAEDVY